MLTFEDGQNQPAPIQFADNSRVTQYSCRIATTVEASIMIPQPSALTQFSWSDQASTDLTKRQRRSSTANPGIEFLTELHEWAGLFTIGSQRILVGDCVDPYIAVYDPSIPLIPGKAILITLEGFFHPANVVRIAQRLTSHTRSLAILSAHRLPYAPISRRLPLVPLPVKTRAPSGKKRKRGKAVGPDDERAIDGGLGQAGGWTLLLQRRDDAEVDPNLGDEENSSPIEWILSESLGDNDAVS